MKIKEIINEQAILKRIQKIAEEIDSSIKEPLVAVCVLKGGYLFFSDLVKALKTPLQIDFVRLASYANGTTSTGNVIITKDLELDINGKSVLIVEDIVDTGRSMAFLMDEFSKRGAKEVKLAVLVNKTERREMVVEPDFVGFEANGFLVGYGMDFAEDFRNLRYIGELISE